MRIGIIGFLHESNTFLARRTTLEDFRRDVLLSGEGVRKRFEGQSHELGGFFSGLARLGAEAVPLFAARAVPSGTIDASTIEGLLGSMIRNLKAAGRLDGILAAPHGATVSASHPDVDGEWLGRVRAAVGPDVPIVATLDLHANLSPAMVEACDALLSYRTNPHLDQTERGEEAARWVVGAAGGSVRLRMAAAFPPMTINIERQSTDEEPVRSLMAEARAAEKRVLSASVLLGFPYADVAEMGSSIVVVTDGDETLARETAASLGRSMWDKRRELAGNLIPVDAAVDRAAREKGPVCLLDMGDNIGGGSPGDGTVLAGELLRRGVSESFACLCDPAGASRAREAGVGASVRLSVGGKTDRLHGVPIDGTFVVESLHDGPFSEPDVRHGGFGEFDQGPTAVVRTGGLTLMITSLRVPPFSLRQLTAFGVDPARFRILVAKGVHAPVAAYREACGEWIRVDTPGVTRADPTAFTYANRRRPMYPFEPEAEWTP